MTTIKIVSLIIAKAAINQWPEGQFQDWQTCRDAVKGEVVSQAATQRKSDPTSGNLLEQEVDDICPWQFLRSDKAQIGKKLAIAGLWKKKKKGTEDISQNNFVANILLWHLQHPLTMQQSVLWMTKGNTSQSDNQASYLPILINAKA